MGDDTYRPIERVGREIAASDYWTSRASSYNAQIAGPYHAHRLSVVERLISPHIRPGARVVDFGCGEGVLVERLARAGLSVLGLDPIDAMAAAAKDRLLDSGQEAEIRTGGVHELDDLPDASTDLLLALNVVGYFEDEEARTFYEQASRIVRPGGALVVTNSNELFDLTTLNRYTVDFHARYLSGPDKASAIAALLTNPDLPRRTTFNVRANPLSYRYLLLAHQFEEQQQEFINFHPLPPLLMDPKSFEDIDAREYIDTLDWPEPDRWKLMFQCSMFGSRAIRR